MALLHHVGNRKWLHVLPKLGDEWNNSKHRIIGMKPAEVNERNEFNLWKATADNDEKIKKRKQTFKIGDYVRVSRAKQIFSKGYAVLI